jgi:hypothetical protein
MKFYTKLDPPYLFFLTKIEKFERFLFNFSLINGQRRYNLGLNKLLIFQKKVKQVLAFWHT